MATRTYLLLLDCTAGAASAVVAATRLASAGSDKLLTAVRESGAVAVAGLTLAGTSLSLAQASCVPRVPPPLCILGGMGLGWGVSQQGYHKPSCLLGLGWLGLVFAATSISMAASTPAAIAAPALEHVPASGVPSQAAYDTLRNSLQEANQHLQQDCAGLRLKSETQPPPTHAHHTHH